VAETYFQLDNGIRIDGGAISTYILNGEDSPAAGAGVEASIGSLYQRGNTTLVDGELWMKYGELDTEWTLMGNIFGPLSSTANAYPRFSGTSGKIVKNGQTVEDDSGNVTIAGGLTLDSGQQITWNAVDKTIDIPTGTGPVLQVGLEVHKIIHNSTGATLPDGSVVYVNGTSISGRSTVDLAIANSIDIATLVIGVMTESVDDGEEGRCTFIGEVRGIDTTGLSLGTIYVSPTTAGELTSTKPTGSYSPIVIGTCDVVDAVDGVVSVLSPYALQPDDLVNQNGFPSSNNSPEKLTISFDDGTRTFSIAPVGDDYYFYVQGRQFRKTSQTILQITNVEGKHYPYFDENGDIQELVNPTASQISTAIRDFCTIAQIFWDSENQEAVIFGDERHGNTMSESTHAYLHFAFGMRWLQGLGLTGILADQDGSSNTHAQVGHAFGIVTDEDLLNMISSRASTVGMPIIYFKDSGNVRRLTLSGFPVIDDVSAGSGATGRLVYNQYTGGIWQLTTVADGYFVNYHLFATNDKDQPIISVMGQNQYDTISNARIGMATEIDTALSLLDSQEMLPLASIIFETQDAYSNAVKARIRQTPNGIDYVDWIVSDREAGTPGSHGNLSGLLADDHLQYQLGVSATETRTLENSTIVSGVLTVTKSEVAIAPESGTADDVTSFSGLLSGQSVKMVLQDPANDTITFKHDGVNISCLGGRDLIFKHGCMLALNNGSTTFIIGNSIASATDLPTDVSSFGGILSSADTNVQLALDTIDDHTHAHSEITSVGADDHHAQSHTIASHSDTTATGAELETLTDGSNADSLHVHDNSITQVVTVGKGGDVDYTTIQAAIDSITVGAGEKYVVSIAPGTYTENVTVKNGVSLVGTGNSGDVIISVTSGMR